MPKYTRIKKIIIRYLNEYGPSNTRKILEYVNEISSTGITSMAMVNVLSKHRNIEKSHSERVKGYTGSYEVCVWQIKSDS